MLRLLFSLIFLLLVCNIQAQDKSNRGREFWLGYGFNYKFFNELPLNNQELAIYISTEQAATVTVSINNTTWSQTLNIPANTVYQTYVGAGNRVTVVCSGSYTALELGTASSAQSGVIGGGS